MSPAPRISYVLGVHNSADFLDATVGSLIERLRDLPGAEIILVENGSSDASAEVCARLARDEPVRVIATTSQKGLGFAFRKGIEIARGDLLVLTGADLPFGFADLDAALALDPRPKVVLGSKAHPDSQIDVTPVRRLLSWGFALARWITLGFKAGDTQGSNLIDGDLARRILPHLRCGDYLIQTEIVAWAVHFGVRPHEVPVIYERALSSTVSPLRDARRMGMGLVRLRGRLRRAAADEEMAAADLAPALRSAPAFAIAALAAGIAAVAAIAAVLATIGGIGRALGRVGSLGGEHPWRASIAAWVIAIVATAGCLRLSRRRPR